MPTQGPSPPQGQATGWWPMPFSFETFAWAVSALFQLLTVCAYLLSFPDVDGVDDQLGSTSRARRDTNGTNGNVRFLAPHSYVSRAFEARPRRVTSLLPGLVRRRGDPKIRLGCDFWPDGHARPNWAWVDIQLTTRHFHNSVPGKLGSCTALRGLVLVGVYQVMKITRDRVNTYGFYSRFGLLSR